MTLLQYYGNELEIKRFQVQVRHLVAQPKQVYYLNINNTATVV